MKLRNNDLKKITEIKQYLLDPPVSFKLYDYAVVYLQNAIAVLMAYPNTQNVITYLESLVIQLQSKEIEQNKLRSTLKEAAIKISQLTNK